jgi:hypothetical protein
MSEREMDMDVERVVNSHSAGDTLSVYDQMHKNRKNQIASRFICCFLCAAAFLLLYFTDLLVGWVSIPAFILFACICSGCVGMALEMSRK